MSRHLDSLKSLYQKMQVRYGEDDAVVLQVKQALESQEGIESKHSWWLAPRIERRSGDTPQRGLVSASGG